MTGCIRDSGKDTELKAVAIAFNQGNIQKIQRDSGCGVYLVAFEVRKAEYASGSQRQVLDKKDIQHGRESLGRCRSRGRQLWLNVTEKILSHWCSCSWCLLVRSDRSRHSQAMRSSAWGLNHGIAQYENLEKYWASECGAVESRQAYLGLHRHTRICFAHSAYWEAG